MGSATSCSRTEAGGLFLLLPGSKTRSLMGTHGLCGRPWQAVLHPE